MHGYGRTSATRGGVGASVLIVRSAFERRGGVLHADDVPLDAIAHDVGTPTFVYSESYIRERCGALSAVLRDVPHRVHYSLKANACEAVLQTVRAVGCGADVVSGGELYRALRAGYTGDEIVFGGVGKTAREIDESIVAGVKLLNVESLDELRLASNIAQQRQRAVDVGLRVNPEVAVESAHRYTKTGERGNKFGIPHDEAPVAIAEAVNLSHVRLRALVMHVGSQLRTLEAYRNGATRLVSLAADARRMGARDLSYLDLGGGLAVRYLDEPETDLEEFATVARAAAGATGLDLILEPGRFLVANAGVLLTRVLYRKRSGGMEVVVVDAGMTELLRPSHYDAYHHIDTVRAPIGSITADIVGPVCESGDFLALRRPLPDVRSGDLLAVHSVGAYGFSMASRYNGRPLVAEVIVNGARWATATVRESYADLVRAEPVKLAWKEA
jgi:diaminopimelate decarboxylase